MFSIILYRETGEIKKKKTISRVKREQQQQQRKVCKFFPLSMIQLKKEK